MDFTDYSNFNLGDLGIEIELTEVSNQGRDIDWALQVVCHIAQSDVGSFDRVCEFVREYLAIPASISPKDQKDVAASKVNWAKEGF